MQTIGKAQVIAQAWEDSLLGRIPKDEKDYPEWYKNRLYLCKKCPKNSSNIAFFKIDGKTGVLVVRLLYQGKGLDEDRGMPVKVRGG